MIATIFGSSAGLVITGESFIKFSLITMLFVAGLMFYIKKAAKWQILDKPNERSSHKTITIRGGGIVYFLAYVLYGVLFIDWTSFFDIMLFSGAIVLAVLSFIDDIKELSAKLRLLIHLLVILLVIYSIGFVPQFGYGLTILVFGLSIVMMNGYNFMDGINGISFQMTLAAGLSLLYIDQYHFDFINANLLVLISLANLVFGVFNFRKKAICFMGDIGSISLGFIFVSLCLFLGLKMESFSTVLVLLVYFIDVVSTIIQRLLKKENILKPHRKHLYQLLVNEYKMSHLVVSGIYFLFQVVVMIVWIGVFDLKLSTIQFVLFLSVAFALYWAIKVILLKKLRNASSSIS
jgi:UDP-GlcNAc:undecaprenyl-phosphate/decaprenyl-phosphate GlcNAc-1-phosphate transferase